jgi:chemotaxis protein MotB
MLRRAEEKAGTPPWFTTFADMNMLLMVFFIALFSLGLMDKPHHQRTEERLREGGPGGISRTGHLPRPGGSGVTKPDETAAFAFEELLAKSTGEMAVANIRGHYVTVARTSEGVAVTIGGELAPFAEGSWEVTAEHRAVLAEVRRWIRGKLNVVLVRGHTASNYEDSVVLDAGRVRPFGPQDVVRRAELADHWLLSSLRANAVRMELARAEGDLPRVDERRIRVRGDAFTSPVADSTDARQRHANRRVEIVLTNELMPD